jgi:dUTP pyrophosphatase
MKLKFKKLNEGATIPTFGNDDFKNAAVDLYACLPDMPMGIRPGSYGIIPTGIAWEPEGGGKYAMLIQSRSGLAFKEHIEASNAGVIDCGYRGEIKVKLYNTGTHMFVVEDGMRVAQGIILVLPYVSEIVETDTLRESARGNSGFGSTGK